MLIHSKNNSAPKLLVFGNPLLDITLTITDDSLLQKYNLEKNGQKEVSLEKLHKLINDAKQRLVPKTERKNFLFNKKTYIIDSTKKNLKKEEN